MRDDVKAAIFISALTLPCLIAFVLYHPTTWTVATPPPLQAASNDAPPPPQFDQFIARYGPPTFEEPSPRGNLQRPLFTKWLDYEPENIRIAFVSASDAQPPEKPTWVAISFVDAAGTQPISAEEAGRRLKSRQDSVQVTPGPPANAAKD